ncbi:MAG: Minf_1886 family protein [Candidatus Omnitrophota bacterium]
MDFYQKINLIIEKDKRYKADAYEFTMQALHFTQNKLNRSGHLTGKELLEGIKEFGLDKYGIMLKNLLEYWGLTSTDDFGEIVFNMINYGLMSKTDNDSKNDFKNVYSFNLAFDIKEKITLENK